jgi:SMI1/KNR4 family protein SUKH-1
MSDFNEFINQQRSISESELSELERLTGYQLPLDFKEHYLLFNGGEPEHCLYMLNGDPIVIQEFLPIAYGLVGSTVDAHFRELALEDKIIPPNLLPFARDPGGDFYCLEMQSGRVIVFRAEYFPELSECTVEIAGSMTEFLNGLGK